MLSTEPIQPGRCRHSLSVPGRKKQVGIGGQPLMFQFMFEQVDTPVHAVTSSHPWQKIGHLHFILKSFTDCLIIYVKDAADRN